MSRRARRLASLLLCLIAIVAAAVLLGRATKPPRPPMRDALVAWRDDSNVLTPIEIPTSTDAGNLNARTQADVIDPGSMYPGTTLVPPTPQLPGGESSPRPRFELLPNWMMGQRAFSLLPNYEPGTVDIVLVKKGKLPSKPALPAEPVPAQRAR